MQDKNEDSIDEDLDDYDDDEDDEDIDEDDDFDDDELDDEDSENKDCGDKGDHNEPVIEHIVLSNTFEELLSRTDLDLLSYIMYDPPNVGDNDKEDDMMEDTTTPTIPNTINRRYVWTSPTCCCRDVAMIPHVPSTDHIYKLDMIITKLRPSQSAELPPKQKHYKIQLSGPNDVSVGPTVMGLLLLLLAPKVSTSSLTSSGDNIVSVTFQAFATNPRLPFPSLSKQMLSSLLSLTTYQTAKTCPSLTLSFVDIHDANTIPTLLSLGNFASVELKQCSTTDDDHNDKVYENLLYYGIDSFTEFLMSCNQLEFEKLATQWCLKASHNTVANCHIKMMHLKLHFWLQGPPMTAFCNALKVTSSVECLIVEYLDIVDEAWYELFQAIAQNQSIRYIKLCFTDNFVDNYRRMTPERRSQRTQAVLQCCTINSSIEEIHWPTFQQDESIMTSIEAALQSNKMSTMMI